MNDIHNQSDTKDNANFAIVTLILFPAFLLIGFYFFFYQTQSYLNSVTEKYAKEVAERAASGPDGPPRQTLHRRQAGRKRHPG